MKFALGLFFWVGTALFTFAQAADDPVPVVRLLSPDSAPVVRFEDIKRVRLRWKDSENKLYAIVQMTNSNRAQGNEEEYVDSHWFWLPGVFYDKEQGIFFSLDKDDRHILLAMEKQSGLFKGIVLSKSTNLRVDRAGGTIRVIADIYSIVDARKQEQALAKAEKLRQESPEEYRNLDAGFGDGGGLLNDLVEGMGGAGASDAERGIDESLRE